MRLPRWTVYPALVLLVGIIIVAIPSRESDSYTVGPVETHAGTGVGTVTSNTRFPRLVVLGIDGLDPEILAEVIERFPERMPNFRKLIGEGSGIHSLRTATPPQSPVAWSNFITGRNPGGHGIYDFIHRDPVSRAPASSTTTPVSEDDFGLPGQWKFPGGSGGDSNRSGESFWSILRDEGVPADIWRMPANFPVEKSKGVSFPGMMTPALDSAYGQCSFYTSDPVRQAEVQYEKLIPVTEFNGRIDTKIEGPVNGFKDGNPHASVPLRIYVDREIGAAAIDVGDEHLVLSPGEWSDFVTLEFKLHGINIPLAGARQSGICRFYLRSVEPEFELYASAVNVDPVKPPMPVSEPKSASADLADAIGPYYTQGMAEDVGALKNGVLDDEEFMAQTNLVFTERVDMMDYALDKYLEGDDGGLLFFYYSTVDLACHMMWRHSDSGHPHHDPAYAARDSSGWSGREGSTWKDTVHDLYLRMDPVLGSLRERVGEQTPIVIMSDHGFAPYRRKFDLNTWLFENGYLVLNEGADKELPADDPEHLPVYIFGGSVDWSKTRAYGMGFNGLYLNLAGREQDNPETPEDESGIVQPGKEAEQLLRELAAKLEAVVDPVTGLRPVRRGDIASDVYEGERLAEAPDMIVGFESGYGNSDEASTGQITNQVLSDNLGGTFNGSHLMAPEVVAGILITNVPVRDGEHGLEDLTVEILAYYGIEAGAGMDGGRVFE